PQMPAPARGEPRLKRTREQRPQDGQPALVQKVYGELHAREILEQLARLAPRVDARQRVPRAVRVAAQKLARREVLPGVLLQTRRVLAQTLHRLARQTVCKREARLRPQQARADAPQAPDVYAVAARVAVVENHDGPATG